MAFVLQGVVRDTGGYAVMLNWTMSNIYGLSPGDVSPLYDAPLASAPDKRCVTRFFW